MPINPVPEPSRTERVEAKVSHATEWFKQSSWALLIFLIGIIIGYIIGGW